jgi:hypothetical protein
MHAEEQEMNVSRTDDRAALDAGLFNTPGRKRIPTKSGGSTRLTRGEQDYVDWLREKLELERASEEPSST